MARADLLIEMVKYSMSDNHYMLKEIVKSLISEERSKQHHILADKLEAELTKSSITSHNAKTFSSGKDSNEYVTEIIPERVLEDLVFPDSIHEIISDFIEEYYRADLLRSYGLEPRNKVLLIGPPGCGKTSLAECIAEKMAVPMYVVNYSTIIGSYLGETALRIKKMIDFVSTRRCVLFLDEFETLGKERGDTHDSGEIKRVVSSLLLHIDALPNYVTIIGATNHPELLDRAVWRRFQIRMTLPLPTKANIVFWLNDFQMKHNLEFGLTNDTIAKRLTGSNYAEIEEFGHNVLRKHVLSLPANNLRSILQKELKNWNINTTKVEP